ncbi:MAG: hypothetical protein DMF62_07265 [Acidobacteria bacterium]|nr:MAG: hypothetical protein DMF62_07265 [Acidobacteriota bacterium]
MRLAAAVSEKEPPEEQDAQDKYQDVDNYFENTHSIDYPLSTPIIPATNSSKIPDANVFSPILPDFYCVGSTFTFLYKFLRSAN